MSVHDVFGNGLIEKINALLRRAGAPRWLHHYGPKKYGLGDHVVALLLRQECRLPYRRAAGLLRELGLRVPTYSALCKMAKRMPLLLWRALLNATVVPGEVAVAAIDSTGLARAMPSWHYVQRIGRKQPIRRPMKLSLMVETRRKMIIAARLRSKPAHDVRDFAFLLNRAAAKPRTIVADKAYDSEKICGMCAYKGIVAMIPPRRGIVRKGFFRKRMLKLFRVRTYNRRQMAESAFSALKRKYGSALHCRSFHNQNVELYCRMVLHNLFLFMGGLFQQSPCSG